ncbi:hypothetical protein MSAN_00467300 [Mycena sanguinolenta]|uniref:Uncharacterized protein n=1 Tax=Mycena sanguinolenta TaxID=230812 RepID=A0A8H7DLN1_9AGAR|nr:hypothetical protein MSAN_00467300 [Mycena sanguinolenta]
MNSPVFSSLRSSSDLDLSLSNQKPRRAHDNDSLDTLLQSDTNLLAITHKAPKKLWYTDTRTLRICAFILHSALIIMHALLFVVWANGFENRITISLSNEKLVSFMITSLTTAFGNVYSAVLVFITQTLATRRSLQKNQMLTTTHDNTAAWAGIGAAVSLMWNQKKNSSRSSILGVLSATTYLAAVLGLHITSSSLFSLVTFNSTRAAFPGTQGLPAFNGTPNFTTFADMETYAAGSLYSLPSVLNSETNQGLHGGTLYEVLDTASPVSGNAIVNATGFNVTCGFAMVPSPLNFSSEAEGYGGQGPMLIKSTQPGMISTPSNFDQLLFYSTIPIIDSDGKQGPLIALNPPMETSVSSIQIFRCSLSLVNQTAVINSQTQEIRTVGPGFTKTTSKWGPYVEVPESEWNYVSHPNVTDENMLINLWEQWYLNIPASDFMLDFNNDLSPASVADVYLIQKLNLPAANHYTQNITLHDLENALSTLVASMFWTLGHIRPPYRASTIADVAVYANGTITGSLNDISTPPILLPGTANVTGVFPEVQLELSIIAVSTGLVVSLVLMTVSLPLLPGGFDEKLPIDGTGVLHTIWLYRNNPELQRMLEQVKYPTLENLRAAGMVRTRLMADRVGEEKTGEAV